MPIDLPRNYTAGQLKLEKILKSMGFQTVLEYPVDQYKLDVFLPNYNIGFEYDGPFHWKKRDQKRDAQIKEKHDIMIMRVTDVNDKDLKEKILHFIEGIFLEEK